MQNLKWRSALLISGVASVLSACGGGSNKPSDTKFETVLNAHYANFKECVGIPMTKNEAGFFYVAEVADDSNPLGAQKNDRDLKPFLALAQAGVMSVEDTVATVQVFSRTKSVPGKGFKLTDVGKSLLLEDGFKRNFGKDEPQLCYGRRIVVEIVNFSEPSETGGVAISSVNYTYKVGDIAEWANLPEIYLRYPHLETYIASTSEDKDDLVLSDDGWVHHVEF